MAESSPKAYRTLWEKEKLLITSVFKILIRQTSKNKGLFGKGLILYHTIPTFDDPEKVDFENIVGKEENTGNQHFLQFPQCFLPFPEQSSIFPSCLFCHLQMLSIWTSQKFCHLVKV